MADFYKYLAEGSSISFEEFSKRLAIVKTSIDQQQIQLQSNNLQKEAIQAKTAATQYEQKKQIEWFKLNSVINSNINTMQTINKYKNDLIDQNDAIYQQNADAVNRAAYIDQNKANREAASYSGKVRSSFAAAGIIVDTGSPESIRQYGLSQIFEKADEDYASKHNTIRQLLSEISKGEAQKHINDLNTNNEINTLQTKVNMV